MRSGLPLASTLLFLIGLINSFNLNAQSVAAEIMAGDKNYLYQHSFSRSFDKTRFSFFHTSSLYAFYGQKKLAEIMSQSYITYTLNPHLKLAVGTFYASVPGFKPAAAFQIIKKTKDVLFILVPRMDLWKNPSGEVMMLLEYRPAIRGQVNFYSKLQLMSNYGPHHNRSYQNLRVGLDIRNASFGLAVNVDEYGDEITTSRNWGIFLRHDF
jgi:hypothetical protein